MLSKNQSVYFMGIAGTGMAAIAGLLKEEGFAVWGSDQDLFPPMSTMLDSLSIQVKSPYSAQNLLEPKPDVVVVSNSLSKNHEEVQEALRLGLTLKSYPQVLGEHFLAKRVSVVVSGTHGKTTTTALLAHLLSELGFDPSYFIGGVPKQAEKSYHLGKGLAFIVEGDEYDTAFFDKESKFLHYCPDFLLINNLEFDHADIFSDLSAIEKMFAKLIDLVARPAQIVANIDDENVYDLLQKKGLIDQVLSVSCEGKKEAKLKVVETSRDPKTGLWHGYFKSHFWGELSIKTQLQGEFNVGNIAMAVALLGEMVQSKALAKIDQADLLKAVASFMGVKRRMDFIGKAKGVEIYEDFAHHPTAVAKVIANFRKSHPKNQLIVAFEPKNASSRRNVFSSAYIEALTQADQVLLGPVALDLRIPEDQRMDTQAICDGINAKSNFKAKAFKSNEDLLQTLKEQVKPEDAVVFMSCGSFSGIARGLFTSLKG